MTNDTMKEYWVHILINKANKVLYTGVTNNLQRRIAEHRQGLVEGVTKKCHVNKLVFCESFVAIEDAISAEKRIKGWTRVKKIALIEKENPLWHDLSKAFFRKFSLRFY